MGDVKKDKEVIPVATNTEAPVKKSPLEGEGFLKSFNYDGQLPPRFQWRGTLHKRDELSGPAIVKLADDKTFKHITRKEEKKEA